MKIAVAGIGYVGLSIATLLAQDNEVHAISTTAAKVDLINNGKSPIVDKEISEYLACSMVEQDGCLDDYDAKEQRRREKTKGAITLE